MPSSIDSVPEAVMTLSARTRRMAQEPVRVELDVFAPGGKRALRLTFGE